MKNFLYVHKKHINTKYAYILSIPASAMHSESTRDAYLQHTTNII